MSDDSRKAFEAWLTGPGGWVRVPATREAGQYINGQAQARWIGWQAALAQHTPAPQADAPLSPQAAKALSARLKADPAFALATLQAAGIATADGKLSEQYGGAVQADALDASRFRWLAENVKETPLRPAAFGAESFPDTRLKYVLPDLVSWTEYSGQTDFGRAADIARGAPPAQADTPQSAQAGQEPRDGGPDARGKPQP